MRAFVFLLVFANLLFYAFSAGHFGRPGSEDAHRMTQQLHPERLRIVSRGEAPAEEKPAPSPPETAKGEPASVCLTWESLPETEAKRIGELLNSRFSDFNIERKPVGEASSMQWWVFIPPQSSRAETERKAGQLRSLGISDYFIVTEGAQRLAISLGIFSAQSRAEERLAELKTKGVRTARVGERPGRESTFSLRATGPRAQHADLLAALAENSRNEAQNCK